MTIYWQICIFLSTSEMVLPFVAKMRNFAVSTKANICAYSPKSTSRLSITSSIGSRYTSGFSKIRETAVLFSSMKRTWSKTSVSVLNESLGSYDLPAYLNFYRTLKLMVWWTSSISGGNVTLMSSLSFYSRLTLFWFKCGKLSSFVFRSALELLSGLENACGPISTNIRGELASGVG